ncbi:glycosyltransferase family protein [Burkholderia diffusa]|uniref:glycosyltransferase family protein n=1 Tax=Burkholderia diffusa TaxID=488732 RepID=UPI0007566BCD|nr:glycosyltransferase [Burkholderia diffusa]KVH47209.1 group 1 glycosyl transferase [Burkholderia diffusa]
MSRIPRLLVVQRISLSHDKLMSRSIAARFGPLLTYMANSGLIEWEEIVESDVTISQLRRFDAVLFNKHTSVRAVDIMKMANDLGLKTIYDMDDWIIDLPMYSVTDLSDDLLANIMWMVRHASVATVSNRVLQERLKRIRSTVVVIPNGFDHHLFEQHDASWHEARPPRILFSNTDGIKLVHFKKGFLRVVSEFMERHPEAELDFWGDRFPEMSRIPRLRANGFLDNVAYKQAIRDAGYLFAIVPLGGREDPDALFFNSCKSCIKYIDYGSLGIPGIYSRTPVYEDAITHRRTALLVDNNVDEWQNALEEMYRDAALRSTLRQNAHEDTRARFGLDRPAQTFMELLTRDA